MSHAAVILFAQKVVKKMCREAHRSAGKKWKTRTYRLLQKFIYTCGGETMPGVVSMLGKPVRTDYLKSALRLLCRDLPSRHAFFYKALPVNVGKWVEALCTYDIDTYTPRSWSMKHAEPRDLTECSTFAELSIYNEVPEFVDFFTAFKQRIKNMGVCAREFNTKEDYEQSLLVSRMRGTMHVFGCTVFAGDRLEIHMDGAQHSQAPSVGRPLVPVKPLRPIRPLMLRPSSDNLAVEDVLGIIARKGVLVAVGSGAKLLALYAANKNGELLKTFADDTFVWKQIADRTYGITHSLWVMKAAQYEGFGIAEDVRTAGMDVPFTLVPGIGMDELSNARFTGAKHFAAIITHAAASTTTQIRDVVHRRVATPLRAQGSDLVHQITLDLKKWNTPRGSRHLSLSDDRWKDDNRWNDDDVACTTTSATDSLAHSEDITITGPHEAYEAYEAHEAHEAHDTTIGPGKVGGLGNNVSPLPRHRSADRMTSVSLDTGVALFMPAEKVVPTRNVPKLCRNAWLTTDGGRVEVVDSLQRDMILGKVRMFGAKRCPSCPPDHPDRLRTERMTCSAPQCPSKFYFYTTTTHYVFKKASGRSLEEDINLPLFADEVLRRLF
jgi:hypothetical protein